MLKNNITITFFRRYFFLLMIIVIVTAVSASFLWTRAAFVEPTFAPAASNQDFPQNILGANNADNAFDSSAVTGNSDGSVIERLEQMASDYLEPRIVMPIDYGTFKNLIWDDWKGFAVATSSSLSLAYAGAVDQNLEEGEWASTTDTDLTATTIASGVVKKDLRTGLYWSDCYSAAVDGTCDTRTNSFTLDGVIGDTDDGLDAEGGQAVDFCEALSLDSDGDGVDETDWYLPSQKELMLAYVNGAGNNIFNPANYFWSSTENFGNPSNAWHVYLASGHSVDYTQGGIAYARCVRR